MTLYAFTDGASRGNPGESGIGFLVMHADGTLLMSDHGYIGSATNNMAEYTALLALLRRMKTIACNELVVHSDSELMVRQLNKQYRVKDEHLKTMYRKVTKLLETLPFTVRVRHVPREQNRDADRLANEAIDTRKKIKV